jgi:phage head maturation protease
MRFYFPIAKVDAEERMVWGYASTEAQDDQGEIIKREAVQAALGDYMRFANIREMHQLSAVGTAKEAGIDDKGLYVGARIVDPIAWDKVKQGVYNGFSIGGKITARDPGDRRIVTGLKLDEISLVDRPANPDAVFDCWKAQGGMMSDQPVQIWHCGRDDHRHLAKAEAAKCIETQSLQPGAAQQVIAAVEGALARTETVIAKAGDARDGKYADPGYQSDGRRRYPINSERHIRAAWLFIHRAQNARRYSADHLAEIKARIAAAWKERIDPDGPPAAGDEKAARRGALGRALCDVGQVARIILDLERLQERFAVEAAMEGDASPQPQRLPAIIDELCGLLNALVAEESGEILDDGEEGSVPAGPLLMAAGAAGAALIGRAALRKLGGRRAGAFLAELAKARHSQGDQALLDLACRAVDMALSIGGLPTEEKSHLKAARDGLRAAGGLPPDERAAGEDNVTYPDAEPAVFEPPAREYRPGDNATVDTAKLPVTIAQALGKRGGAGRALSKVAHHCLVQLTDGQVCRSEKTDPRHSSETLDHLQAAHDHLVEAGATCGDLGAAKDEAVLEGGPTLAADQVEKAALIKTLADVIPRIDQLAKRVEDIAATPLLPLTIAKGVTTLSKQQDVGGDSRLSPEELAAAFAKMSPEEQTMTLIKASYKNPIRMPA